MLKQRLRLSNTVSYSRQWSCHSLRRRCWQCILQSVQWCAMCAVSYLRFEVQHVHVLCPRSPVGNGGSCSMFCPWSSQQYTMFWMKPGLPLHFGGLGPDLCLRVVPLEWGGGVRGLWVGGLLWFWAIWPNVPNPPPRGGGGVWVGGWVGGQLGRGQVGLDSPKTIRVARMDQTSEHCAAYEQYATATAGGPCDGWWSSG